ncbi:hypothetical protein P152DRAFT_125308 [Eremomyces bilateralis CBS 781.70]|uniref:TPR-like protein n=1 Tax=Eremomyces bilateralis CBS 781.70 TaxID=1392243 RepID=A0A6G1GEI5_9PEZI|nr:uncharacterized protein P152DRAFT_125308 [Eremomyces bilateralis CBS 781.70]KAF1816463.1 hypothetical protein P152DRAFT_125308 [Eremomyces bilateralis CBS 781.70]
MYMRALQGYEEILGPKHTSTLGTVNCLGTLYANQGKLKEAEEMYIRALQGYEEALDSETLPRYRPALNTISNLGDIFATKGEVHKAKTMYTRALTGFQVLLGPSCDQCQQFEDRLFSLDLSKEELADMSGTEEVAEVVDGKGAKSGRRSVVRRFMRKLVR